MFLCVIYLWSQFYGSCGTWETKDQCDIAGENATKGVPGMSWSCGPNRTYRPRGR